MKVYFISSSTFYHITATNSTIFNAQHTMSQRTVFESMQPIEVTKLEYRIVQLCVSDLFC